MRIELCVFIIAIAIIAIGNAVDPIIINNDPNYGFGDNLVINLSGTSEGVFGGSLFAKDGLAGAGGVFLTPSQKGFLEDRGEGIPGNVTPRNTLKIGLMNKGNVS